MKVIICCFFCLCILNAFSQDSSSVVVRKDGRLDILTAKQVSLNKRAARMTSTGLYHGYRLQVLNTQSRDKAYQLKSELLQRFPEQKCYVLYQSPYFKIRFGNFIDRSEALRYKSILSSIYPQVIYVVNDNVEYKPPKDEEDTDSQ